MALGYCVSHRWLQFLIPVATIPRVPVIRLIFFFRGEAAIKSLEQTQNSEVPASEIFRTISPQFSIIERRL